MELTLFTHENVVGEEVSKALKNGKYTDFKVAVAYSRNSGISRIYNELAEFSNNGGTTSVIAGIDQGNTSYQALINLKTFAKDNLFIHHDRNLAITFHPKIYMFGNKEIEKIIVGSSNFTAGGLFLNYEANIGVTIDDSKNALNFQKQVIRYWDELLKEENTKKCESNLLEMLLARGSIVDERKQKPFQKIIEEISDLPFKKREKLRFLPPVAGASVIAPSLKEKFAMTLSGFDVSAKSQDPVILIPLAALKEMPIFWNWPMLYTNSGAGYPQLYATATITIDGNTFKDQHIRIYYYDGKKEFRLQCEVIKRNGKQGDIIYIHRNYNDSLEFEIELMRRGSTSFNTIRALLVNKASTQKYFTYY
ncbi:phospholipase D-like domain-containing protein [Candidatus Spongiihabitans sp.]|uniref:phospholipase D-like domain-containing protein n=1 Tax=Candidatus Spongiihabitans sp. TaxID=3101308 RepID=UPI003C79D4D8